MSLDRFLISLGLALATLVLALPEERTLAQGTSGERAKAPGSRNSAQSVTETDTDADSDSDADSDADADPDTDADPGKGLRIVKVSKSCYAVLRPGGASNAGFVVGEESVLVVDCFDSPERGRELLAGIARVTDKPIKQVVLTHAHYDHVVGNQAMPKDVKIYATQDAGRWLINRLKKDRLLLGPSGGGIHGTIGMRSVREPTMPIEKRTDLDLGGVKVSLVPVGDCHAVGELVVRVESEKVLYTGDLVWSACLPNISAGSTFRWIGVLARMGKLEVEHVIPGHGKPGKAELLAAQRHYLMELRSTIKHLARNKVEVEKIVSALTIPEEYAEYANAAYWPKNIRFVYNELVSGR